MKNLLIAILCFLPFLSTAQLGSAENGNPSTIVWKEISNESARIIFPKGLEKRAGHVADVIDYLNKTYKHIDALVNSAYPRNKNFGKDVFDIDYDDFVENLGLNLGGYFLTSQQFAKYFKKQGYGNIVNISSIYGVVAPKFEIYEGTNMNSAIEYAAIKAGLIHMTKYMAKYFKGLNIRVNCLSPGGILNDGQPENFLQAYKDKCINKGMLDKEDLEGSLVYLLSDMSKYVNGQNIIVDDGFVL